MNTTYSKSLRDPHRPRSLRVFAAAILGAGVFGCTTESSRSVVEPHSPAAALTASDDHIQTFSATLTLTSSHPNATAVTMRAPRVGAPIHITASRNPDDTWRVEMTRPTETGDLITVVFPGDGTAPFIREGSGHEQPLMGARNIAGTERPQALSAGPVVRRWVEGFVLTPTEIARRRADAEVRFGAPSLTSTQAVFQGAVPGQDVAVEQRFDATTGLLTEESVTGAGVASLIHHTYETLSQGSYYRRLTRVERSKGGALESVVEQRLSDVSFSFSK